MMKFFALLLTCISLCPQARALELSPFYGVEQKRDTNIYLTDTDATASWINISSVGFSAAHRKDAVSLDASYGIGKISYSTDKSANDYVSHDAALSLAVRPSTATAVLFCEHYLVTTDPAVSEQTQRLQHGQNLLSAAVKTPLKDGFGIFVDASALKLSYFADYASAISRAEYAFRAGVDYELDEHMRAFAAYERGIINYESASSHDSTYNQPALGLEGALLPGVSVYAEVNVQLRSYKEGLASGGYTADDKTTSYGGRVELLWVPNADSRLRIGVSRANRESQQALSRYYISTITELGITQKVQRFILDAGTGLEFLDSPEVTPTTGGKRKTTDMFAGAGLAYEASRAFTIGVKLSSRTRNSNEAGLGFADQVYNFYIKGRL